MLLVLGGMVAESMGEALEFCVLIGDEDFEIALFVQVMLGVLDELGLEKAVLRVDAEIGIAELVFIGGESDDLILLVLVGPNADVV